MWDWIIIVFGGGFLLLMLFAALLGFAEFWVGHKIWGTIFALVVVGFVAGTAVLTFDNPDQAESDRKGDRLDETPAPSDDEPSQPPSAKEQLRDELCRPYMTEDEREDIYLDFQVDCY